MKLRSVFYVFAISYCMFGCNKSTERPVNPATYSDIYVSGFEDNGTTGGQCPLVGGGSL